MKLDSHTRASFVDFEVNWLGRLKNNKSIPKKNYVHTFSVKVTNYHDHNPPGFPSRFQFQCSPLNDYWLTMTHWSTHNWSTRIASICDENWSPRIWSPRIDRREFDRRELIAENWSPRIQGRAPPWHPFWSPSLIAEFGRSPTQLTQF